MIRRSVFISAVLLFCVLAVAQTPVAPTTIIEHASPSVAVVLAAGPDQGLRFGTAVIVRSDGVLLTAYHVVRGAREVQVRTKDGEIYDQVQLLAYDERRDVAALRIPATGLRAVTPAALSTAAPGARVFVIAHPLTLAWTASEGVLSAVRVADEVPGAGKGYRVVQFTAAASPGSSGGVLLDEKGEALGIVVAGYSAGQNINFAVPFESVMGLASAATGTAFASGKDLHLPAEAARNPVAAEPSVHAPAANPVAAESSDVLVSRDPKVMLRTFRTVYVDSKTVWLKPDVMQAAISRQPEFAQWNIVVVSDPKVADMRLTVNRVLFTWDFTYELTHRNTGMVIHTGKLTAPDGLTAAPKIAGKIVDLIKPVRPLPETDKKPKEKKTEAPAGNF